MDFAGDEFYGDDVTSGFDPLDGDDLMAFREAELDADAAAGEFDFAGGEDAGFEEALGLE